MKNAWLRIISCLIVCTLLLSACALSFETKDTPEGQASIIYPNKPEPPKMVEVQFLVKTLQNFSQQDSLALDLLDLVGGFKNNLERYQLNQVESGKYQLNVSLPEGATIAYRYTMLEPMQMNELLINGSELPFRQAFVKKGLIVSDQISAWPENPYQGALADLNGAVADSDTEQPIADAMVNVAGHITMTDMNGRFYLRGLPVGVHNFVVSTIDGSHQSFQQEVNLMDGLSTLAIARMIPNPEVTLTFVLTPPQEVFGAPIRIVGNLESFGQTLADQTGGSGVQAVNAPALTRNDDGTYVSQVKTYAGNVLRYSYTLGDSLIGIERNEQGLRTVRQFVVPNKDAVLNDSVITWRSSVGSPSTFYAQPPAGTPAEDQLYIQFNQGNWSYPIPMWQASDGQWVFVFFPGFSEPATVQYRYCRFADCSIGLETDQNNTVRSMEIGTQNEFHDQITAWRMFDPQTESSLRSPAFDQDAQIGVELDFNYSPNFLRSYERLLSDLEGSKINWIILRPAWQLSFTNGLPYLNPETQLTIPSSFISKFSLRAKEAGYKIAIYPKVDIGDLDVNWWQETQKNSLWWQQWYSEYERLVTHLIKLANNAQADQLIIGGPDVWQSYPGALETVGQNYGTPKSSEEIWVELIDKTQQYYEGEILLAHSVNELNTQRYSFYDKVDGIYLLIDLELSSAGYYSSDSVGQYLDGVIYSAISGTEQKLFIGLNAPSYKTSSTGQTANNSQTLSPTNSAYGAYNVDINAQTNFYSAYIEALAARSWVSGIVSRGFFPGIKLSDFSSSIYGKPAFQLFQEQ